MAALRRALQLLGAAPAGDSRWLSGHRGLQRLLENWKAMKEIAIIYVIRTFMIIHLKHMDMILSV